MNTGSRGTSSITPAARRPMPATVWVTGVVTTTATVAGASVGEGRYLSSAGATVLCEENLSLFSQKDHVCVCVKHCLREAAGRRAGRREVPAVAPWRGSGLHRGNKRPRQEAAGAWQGARSTANNKGSRQENKVSL